MIRILVVEDEPAISSLIALSLKKAGYACECIADGEAAADRLQEASYDLILLDVMLPGLSGFELMEQIRPLGTPVIFLTARNAVEDRVRGLRMGAEDYLVKPFAVVELLARVDVVLRRYRKADDECLVNGLRILPRSMQVFAGEQEIPLTRREFELLLLFVRNPNAALYRETIYERIWGGELEYGSKAVDLQVQRLRRKLGWEEWLQAVNGVGYRLEVRG
jgi:DNA-binding response OmpR family regulator